MNTVIYTPPRSNEFLVRGIDRKMNTGPRPKYRSTSTERCHNRGKQVPGTRGHRIIVMIQIPPTHFTSSLSPTWSSLPIFFSCISRLLLLYFKSQVLTTSIQFHNGFWGTWLSPSIGCLELSPPSQSHIPILIWAHPHLEFLLIRTGLTSIVTMQREKYAHRRPYFWNLVAWLTPSPARRSSRGSASRPSATMVSWHAMVWLDGYADMLLLAWQKWSPSWRLVAPSRVVYWVSMLIAEQEVANVWHHHFPITFGTTLGVFEIDTFLDWWRAHCRWA